MMRILGSIIMSLLAVAIISAQCEAPFTEYTVVNDSGLVIDVEFFTSEVEVFERTPEYYNSIRVGEPGTGGTCQYCGMQPSETQTGSWQFFEGFDNYFVARDSSTNQVIFFAKLSTDELESKDFVIQIMDLRKR